MHWHTNLVEIFFQFSYDLSIHIETHFQVCANILLHICHFILHH